MTGQGVCRRTAGRGLGKSPAPLASEAVRTSEVQQPAAPRPVPRFVADMTLRQSPLASSLLPTGAGLVDDAADGGQETSYPAATMSS